MMRGKISLLLLLILLAPIIITSSSLSSTIVFPGEEYKPIGLDSNDSKAKTDALIDWIGTDESIFYIDLNLNRLKGRTSDFSIYYYGVKKKSEITFYKLEDEMTEDNLDDIDSLITGNGLFWAWDSSTSTSYRSASATPEPATMFLFGFGLLGLAGVIRRKK